MQRIWNEEELKSMPEWRKIDNTNWIMQNFSTHSVHIDMLGQEITDEFKKHWRVLDYMIAKAPKDEVISDNEILDSSVNAYTDGGKIIYKPNNMETKKVTLSNGTVLEVGKKYTLGGWEDGSFVDIKFIDSVDFAAKDEDGFLIVCDINENWLPHTTPTPKKEWKTFLIEVEEYNANSAWSPARRDIVQMYSIEDAKRLYPKAKITEVKLNIEEVK